VPDVPISTIHEAAGQDRGWDARSATRCSVARDELIQTQGRVVEALAGGHFRVEGDQGHSFLARISGRLRRYHIKVVPGDRVTIAVSPYDLTHGFIVYRSS